MSRWLEILVAVRDDLYAIMQDPTRWEAELPPRIRKLMERAQGSAYIDLEEGTGRVWYLGKFWAEAPDSFDEFDPVNDPTIRWLDTTFTQEWHWMRPFSVWWWHNGMMIGTQYAPGPDGEAGDVDLTVPPVYPWDYARAKRWIPDYIDPETEQVYDLVWDMIPDMITVGQHTESRGRPNIKRRAMQETTNQKLGHDAFGVPEWSPAVAQARRRRRS